MTSYQHSTSDANSVGNYTHVHRNTKYKIMQTTTDSVQSIIMQSISCSCIYHCCNKIPTYEDV